MLKNWKSLFVKTTGEETDKNEKTEKTDSFSFPVNNSSATAHTAQPAPAFIPQTVNNPEIQEVLEIYESGLDSINMPGYDFYEFYMAISSTGHSGEQSYQMAYQMAKAFDKTITAQKLVTDAEFYISKINEVHGQYVMQGQQKLSSIQGKKVADKSALQNEIDEGSRRLAQLRVELQQLEATINQKKSALTKIDESFNPQEKSIREKMQANDLARTTSIDKLNAIKDGILRYIKP